MQKSLLILVCSFVCQQVLSQEDNYIEHDSLPFISKLKKVKKLRKLEIEKYKLPCYNITDSVSINSTIVWELVGFIERSSASGGIPDEMKGLTINYYKSKRDKIRITSDSIPFIFKSKKSKDSEEPKIIDILQLFDWQICYDENHLLISKRQEYQGGIMNYQSSIGYYFRKNCK